MYLISVPVLDKVGYTRLFHTHDSFRLNGVILHCYYRFGRVPKEEHLDTVDAEGILQFEFSQCEQRQSNEKKGTKISTPAY